MRIGIDITPLQNGHSQRGVGEYARHLLNGLSQVDDDNDYLLFGYGKEFSKPALSGRFKFISAGSDPGGIPSRLKWHQFTLPRLLVKYKPDVLHLLVQTYDINIPFWRPAKVVVTVHDLKAKLFPDLYLNNIYKRASYSLMLNLTARADHIITDSENSKRDITQKLSIAAGKVSVIPLAANPLYSGDGRPNGPEADVVGKYRLAAKFMLFVGAIEPSKNIRLLLSAYQELQKKGLSAQLVLVGVKDANYFAGLKNEFGHLFGDKVRFLDFVSFLELRELYRRAVLFVYPSLYEGFGLPVLEAMACGTPVIAGNVSSIPEVAADGALLVDPNDQNQLVESVWMLSRNADARRELAAKGLAQARRFSWAKCAKQTLAVYRQVVGAVS